MGNMKKQRILFLTFVLALGAIGITTLALVAGQNEAREPTPAPLAASLLDPPLIPADFSLPATTSSGNFRLSDQRGKVVLLYFGFMACPDFCPSTLAKMQQLKQHLGAQADQVVVVFVTVDPERDTLDRLGIFLAGFDPAFIGVWPEGAALEALRAEFLVTVNRRLLPDSALGYTLDHTTAVYIIDPQGRWVGRFPYEAPAADMAKDLQRWLP
jgi:protein SCO1/2